MDRTIIHLNVADFAVAVERRVDGRLRGRPVVVAPEGGARAAVYDMSEEAFRSGIRKGMALRGALRLCRDARIVPPHPERYERAMEAIFRKALSYSPRIETGEIDGHLFADLTGTGRLFGPAEDVALRLRRETRAELGFDPIWSVASNKLMAKVATRVVKPDGECIVRSGEEAKFLAPLPLDMIPGIEREKLVRLKEFNFTRVHEVAALSLEQIEIPFGSFAPVLYDSVRGIDESPVLAAGEKPPRESADHTFAEDTNDGAVLEAALYRMVEKAGEALRRRRLCARRIGILLEYSDGARCLRQGAAKPATADDVTLFAAARGVLETAWRRRVRVRRLRLICDRLVFPPAQMELFSEDGKSREKNAALGSAIDKIRERFGPGAICKGRTLAASPSFLRLEPGVSGCEAENCPSGFRSR